MLADWACQPDLIDNVQVVVSELVTNAVLHGGGAVSMALALVGDVVRVEVGDRSGLLPARSGYGRAASTGRGLALVASLSQAWDFEPGEAGKLVWAEVPLVAATGDTGGTGPGPAPGAPLLAGEGAGVLIVWKRVPIRAYQALQEQNDAVQREVDLLLIGTSDGLTSLVSEELLHLCQRLRDTFGRPTSSYRAVVAAAASRGEGTVDLDACLPVGSTGPARTYLELFEQIEAFAADGHLLVQPPRAEVRWLRRWFVDELVGQMGGAAANPCAPP